MTTESTGSDSSSSQPQPVSTSPSDKRYSFDELAGGKSVVTIEHEGQQYRLVATKNGRLLLNK